MNLQARLPAQEGLDVSTSVKTSPVPQENHRSSHVSKEVAQKPDDLRLGKLLPALYHIARVVRPPRIAMGVLRRKKAPLCQKLLVIAESLRYNCPVQGFVVHDEGRLEDRMDYISDDGKTVTCPECMRRNPFKEPVKVGQFMMCHNCRKRLQIKMIYGRMKPFPVESIYESTKGGDGKKRVRGSAGH